MYEIELLNFFEKDEVDDFYRLTPVSIYSHNYCKHCNSFKVLF